MRNGPDQHAVHGALPLSTIFQPEAMAFALTTSFSLVLSWGKLRPPDVPKKLASVAASASQIGALISCQLLSQPSQAAARSLFVSAAVVASGSQLGFQVAALSASNVKRAEGLGAQSPKSVFAAS